MDPSRELALVAHEENNGHHSGVVLFSSVAYGLYHSTTSPILIATILSGFKKGDFLVREEKGQRVYFNFFEEAFNYIAYKGYIHMPREEEAKWMNTMNNVHASVKGGMKYNTGKLLMVLFRPIHSEKL